MSGRNVRLKAKKGKPRHLTNEQTLTKLTKMRHCIFVHGSKQYLPNMHILLQKK